MGRRARERYEARLRRECFAKYLAESKSFDSPASSAKPSDPVKAFDRMSNVLFALLLVILVAAAFKIRHGIDESKARAKASTAATAAVSTTLEAEGPAR